MGGNLLNQNLLGPGHYIFKHSSFVLRTLKYEKHSGIGLIKEEERDWDEGLKRSGQKTGRKTRSNLEENHFVCWIKKSKILEIKKIIQ